MNIVYNINQFNTDYVYLCEPIKNNIMSEGTFIRILYSTSLFTMTGVYLYVPFYAIQIEKYYNKYKCTFDMDIHKDIINQIKSIEESILNKISIPNKLATYKIYEQFKTGNIKIFSESIDKIKNIFMLKISGIWETDTQYGVTYKFSNITN